MSRNVWWIALTGCVVVFVVACGLWPSREPLVTFTRAEWEARIALGDHLWPILVEYVEHDPTVEPEDRDRIYLACGAMLASNGTIDRREVDNPALLIARGRALNAESTFGSMARLTRNVLDDAARRAARADMDAAIGSSLRAISSGQ